MNVFIQMRRPSDGTVSDPLPFKFTPDDTGKKAFWLLRTLKPDFEALAKILADLTHPLTKEILALRRSSSPVQVERDATAFVDEMDADAERGSPPAERAAGSGGDGVVSDEDEEEDDDDENESADEELEPEQEKPSPRAEEAAAAGESVAAGAEQTLQAAIDDLSTVAPDKLSELGLVLTAMDDEVSAGEAEDAMGAQRAATVEEQTTLKRAGDDAYELHASLRVAVRNAIRIPERITFAGRRSSGGAQPPYELMAAPPPPRPPAASKPRCFEAPSEVEPLPPLPPKRTKRNATLNRSLPALPQKETKLALLQKLFFSRKKKKSKTQPPAAAADENDEPGDRRRGSLAEYAKEQLTQDCLTEAEHYALYTSVAPRASVSEFDENSCYYSPVEAEPVK